LILIGFCQTQAAFTHSQVHNEYFWECLSISLCDRPKASEGWQAG